jgi:hypothetical protein
MPTRCCVGMCRADRQHAHANSGVGMPPGEEYAHPRLTHYAPAAIVPSHEML